MPEVLELPGARGTPDGRDVPEARSYDFAGFTLDLDRGCLRCGDEELRLRPKSFELLCFLVRRPQRLLAKNELIDAVWRDTFVTEDSLVQCVLELRRALGDKEQRLIRTVPRRGYLFTPEVRSREAPRPLVLAVLPFASLGPSQGESADYLELGLADALITQLGRWPGLVVRPMGSVRRFAGGDVEPLDAGRRLDADVLVTGGVQAAGERVRVTVHVLRVQDAATIWTGAFEEPALDLFAVQDIIGVQIAKALAPELGRAPTPDLSAPLTTNAEAYEHYLRGRILWTRRSRETLLEAADHFQRATELDPEFALAHAALGQVLGPLGFLNYLPAAPARQRMRAAAEAALALDPSLADARVALAACLGFHEWRWEEAETEFQRALAHNPHDATARVWYGLQLFAEGRLDEAIAQRRRAFALDPLSPIHAAELGTNLVARGDLTAARELYQQALALEPRFWRAKLSLAELEEREGRLEAAIPLYEQAVADSGNAAIALAELAAALADSGQRDRAEALLALLQDPARTEVVSPVAVAIAHAGLGGTAGAFEWLERAFRDGDPQLTDLAWRPRLVRLAQDPRYHALLEKVGLAPRQVAARARRAR